GASSSSVARTSCSSSKLSIGATRERSESVRSSTSSSSGYKSADSAGSCTWRSPTVVTVLIAKRLHEFHYDQKRLGVSSAHLRPIVHIPFTFWSPVHPFGR